MKKISSAIFTILLIMGFAIGANAADYVYCASVEGTIALHISPNDESYRITQIPACSKLRLIKTQRTWGLVEFKNKCGWINLSFTRDTYDKAAEATGNDSVKNIKVNSGSDRAVLYNVPSLSEVLGSEQKYMVPNDMVLQIKRETASGWGLASMNGKYAWIEMKDTKRYETDTEKETDKYGIYYVYVLSDSGEGLELRDAPGGNNLYAVIPDCIKLTVRETKGNYAYVSYDGINGWIDLRYTTQSLSNAQSNAGTAVNVEYEVAPLNDAESQDILSVPSDNAGDGGYVVGSIKKGSAVFVLRNTLSGWSLVNHGGTLGWLPPGSVTPAQNTQEDIVSPLASAREGYVNTPEGRGMKLYALRDDEDAVATIPEGVKVSVIAEKDGYEYVYCDYAAGWALPMQTAMTQEEAFASNLLKNKEYYLIDDETMLMSLPTYSTLCGSSEIITAAVGTYFEVSKIVTTGKRKWGLTQIDGKQGFINLNCANETTSPFVIVLSIVLTLFFVIAIALLIYNMVKKKKLLPKKQERTHKNEKKL